MLPLESVRVRPVDEATNQKLVQLLIGLSDNRTKEPRRLDRAQSILYRSRSTFVAELGEYWDPSDPMQGVDDAPSPLNRDDSIHRDNRGAMVVVEIELAELMDAKTVKSLLASTPTWARRDIQWSTSGDEKSDAAAARRAALGKWASATYDLRHQAETSPLSIPSTALDAYMPHLGMCSLWMSHQGLALNILPREVSSFRSIETKMLPSSDSIVSKQLRPIQNLFGRLKLGSEQTRNEQEAVYKVYVVFLSDITEIRTVDGTEPDGDEDGGLDVSNLPSVKLVLSNGSYVRFHFAHDMIGKAFSNNIQAVSRASLSVKRRKKRRALLGEGGALDKKVNVNVEALFTDDIPDRHAAPLKRSSSFSGRRADETSPVIMIDVFDDNQPKHRIALRPSTCFSDSLASRQPEVANEEEDAAAGGLGVAGFDDFFSADKTPAPRRAGSANATESLAVSSPSSPLRRRKDGSSFDRSAGEHHDSAIATSFQTAQQAIQVAEHEALQHQSTLENIAEAETQFEEAPVSILCDDVFHESTLSAVVADIPEEVREKVDTKEPEKPSSRGCCAKLQDGLMRFEDYQNQTIVYTWEATNLRALVSKQNKRTQNLVLAKRLQYHEWPSSRLIWTVAIREHPFPKVFPYNPLISRCQRYLIEFSSIVTELFFTSLFFNAECVSRPSPEVCFPLINPFVPSWHVLFSSLWGVVLAVPIPLFLRFCFAKRIVEELSTPAEKTFILHYWRIKDLLGYTVVSLWDAFCIYFILLFILKYDDTLVFKWTQTAILALFNRIVTAPTARTLWVSAVLLISKKTWICDFLLMAWPALIAFTHPDITKLKKRAPDNKTDMAESEAWPLEAHKEERTRLRLPAAAGAADPFVSRVVRSKEAGVPHDEDSELSDESPMIIPTVDRNASRTIGKQQKPSAKKAVEYDEYYIKQRSGMPYF